eukprot:TRINITY_DN25491_c0_g1_i1.p1 TRINITY_DN25491_c0_g1~~TRINITY_DN25491_c0_g1_i1.p1  ORF type:complete len:628 (+),score=182.88 TRINITY_DN25491_c0_g1_i1:58-1884(+)
MAGAPVGDVDLPFGNDNSLPAPSSSGQAEENAGSYANLLAMLATSAGTEQQAVLRHLLSVPFEAGAFAEAHAKANSKQQCALRRYVQHSTVKAFYDKKYLPNMPPAPSSPQDELLVRSGGGGVQDVQKVRLPERKTDVAPKNTFEYLKPPRIPASAQNRNHLQMPLFDVVNASPLCVVKGIAARQVVQESSIAVVSPAHPDKPGGGYKKGAATVEADYHRRSNIFNCLDDPQRCFSESSKYPLKPQACYFSKDVCVIRGAASSGYPFLPAPYYVNVVTSCLADPGPVQKQRAMELDVLQKLRTLFGVCAYFHIKWIVIPMIPRIARLVKDVLQEKEHQHCFYRVSFALPAPTDAPADLLAEYLGCFGGMVELDDMQVGRRSVRKRELEDDVNPGQKRARLQVPAAPNAGTQQQPPALAQAAPPQTLQELLETGLAFGDPQKQQRLSIRARFLKALQEAGDEDKAGRMEALHRKAAEIETAMHTHFKDGPSSPGYRSQLKTLVLNLQDKKNASLRQSIVDGAVSAGALPKMSAKELCNPQKLAEESSMRTDIMAEMMATGTVAQETSMHTCGRCKRKRCAFYELQIRSGDEPMTQFIRCLHCGNNWRIG